LLGGAAHAVGNRNPVDQIVDLPAVASEQGVGRATSSRQRHLRRDERVAVAIASHPASETDPGGAPELAAEDRLERAFGRGRQIAGGGHQPVFQVPDDGVDLVENAWAIRTDLVREPEHLDVGFQLLLEPRGVAARCLATAEQCLRNACLQIQQRAARGFGRVRGEHRPHLEPTDQLAHGVGRHSLGLHLLERPGNAGRLRFRLAELRVLFSAPHPVHLLCRVDQKEQ
jgi:hypothetical protein